MKRWSLLLSLAATACGDSTPGSESETTSVTTTATTTSPGTSAGTTSSRTTSSSGTSASTSSSTTGSSASVDDSTTRATTAPVCDSNPETGGRPGTTGGGNFVFLDELQACDFVQIDRVGKPLIARLLVSDPDAYNQGNPLADSLFTFDDDIDSAIFALHDTLDAALMSGGFMPCLGACSAQTTSFLYPDTLLVEPAAVASFPNNGRRLDDPAADRVLGRLLLDLGNAHAEDDFADIPLNPPTNDVDFLSGWPHLAPPHL